MTEKQFLIFCRVLKWSTNLSLTLMTVSLALLLFVFFIADDKPWVGVFAFIVFVGGVYNNYEDKKKFIAGKKVSKGHHGTTGVMFPLWQNIVFWFIYISLEFIIAGVAISAFAKAIWPS